MALPDNGLFGAIAGKKSYPQLKLHADAVVERHHVKGRW